MTKDPMRKCSQCGNNGHNSRTCCKGCTSIKLFGVKINVVSDESPPPSHNDSSIRRTKSMGSLLSAAADHRRDSGYLSSDDLFLHSARSATKKGSTWSEEEHRGFLIGLEKLGKGDWRGISRTYVPTRTPTQVASHAQKYFIRISCLDKKKRRTSVFDMPLNQTTTSTSMEQQNAPSQGIPSPSSDEPAPRLDPPKQACSSVSPPSKNDESNVKVLERVDKGLQIPPKGKPYSVSNHERPPLPPPPPLLVVPSFNCMPYMVKNLSAAAGRVIPAVSWGPLPAYPNQSYGGYVGNFHGHYAASCVQYMASPQSAAALPPLAGGPPPSSKQDGLHLPFGALTL